MQYLDRLKEQEQTLQQQLAKIDANAAARIFSGSEQEYEKIQSQLKNNSENVLNGYGHDMPGIDSAITSLKFLQQQLAGYNMGTGLQQYTKQAYYYSRQMNDLKQSWDDPSRAEQKAMTLLNKYKPFQDFMRKNSLIAGLFNIPDEYSTAGLAGLQTRDQVQQLTQQQMTMMGPGGGNTAQQNIANAQSTMTTLRR